ncbi:hypothetical protein BH09VER1_BH09VER1_09410 [soil metagenome]
MRLALRILLIGLTALATTRAEDNSPLKQWTVDGVTREALVYAPAQAMLEPTPVLFVFHGHGGTMAFVSSRTPFHQLWPGAIVVYPQGLNTPGQITDPNGTLPGWQKTVGDQGDRDLKFFDAMLASLRKDYMVDDKHIFVTGHSNGGAFTYLLWATRGDTLAAVAPTAAAALRLLDQLKPKPAFILGGENDPLVKFVWQQNTINAVLAIDQCGKGQPGARYCTNYSSPIDAPVTTYIHPGGHQFPAEAAPLIVKFFQDRMAPGAK